MRDIKYNHSVSDCRHRPVGRNTRFIDRFRFWFIFTDYAKFKHCYTVGMVKCVKCGEVLRIPELYYSIPVNLLYLVCYAALTFWQCTLFISVAHQNKILLVICVFAALFLTYLLVDRLFWFAVMHFCKWHSEVVNPEDQKAFIQNESERFEYDRRIKSSMCLLGIGLGQWLLRSPPRWHMSFIYGTLVGVVILILARIIRKHRSRTGDGLREP